MELNDGGFTRPYSPQNKLAPSEPLPTFHYDTNTFKIISHVSELRGQILRDVTSMRGKLHFIVIEPHIALHELAFSQPQSANMKTLDLLPDELLVLICQHLTLQSLFNFRLTHPHFATLVIEHGSSIAQPVAQTTFPDATILLHTRPDEKRDFAWLKCLVPKYLATVLVDRFMLSSERVFMEPSWIPAESEIGDNLRARVENGWKVIQSLGYLIRDEDLNASLPSKASDVARSSKSSMSLAVSVKRHIQHASSFLTRGLRPSSRTHKHETLPASTEPQSSISGIETLQHHIQAYLHDLPLRSLQDYQITTFLLYLAFRTKHDQPPLMMLPTHRFTYTGCDDFDWTTDTQNPTPSRASIMLENHNSWVNYAILRLGPQTFLQQWCPENRGNPITESLVKERLLCMWESESEERRERGRRIALSIREALQERHAENAFWTLKIEDDFLEYKGWELGLKRFHSKEELPRDWLDGCPYFVDFTSE
jgi:hypothetical protein